MEDPIKLKWHNEKRKVKELTPFLKNPRKITPKRQRKLGESLEKFDLVEVPVINIDNEIVVGHQRIKLKLMQGKGEEMIDIRVPNRLLTQQEVREYNIVSNISAGEWDDEKLGECDEDLLRRVGFEDAYINRLFSKDKETERPEIPFAEFLREAHNYVVLYFDNEVDWLQAQSVLGLKIVKAYSTRKDGKENKKVRRIGLGRVIKGEVAINKLLKDGN